MQRCPAERTPRNGGRATEHLANQLHTPTRLDEGARHVESGTNCIATSLSSGAGMSSTRARGS